MRAEGLEVARARISLWEWDAGAFIICILPISCGLSQVTVQGKRCFPFSEPVAGEESKSHLWMENRAFNFKFCKITNLYLALCLSI